MSEANTTEVHTPGPWHLGIGGNFHGNRVWAKDMRPVVMLLSMGTVPSDLDPEAQANGRLIAAAPDLLEFVRQYASECSECDGTGRTGSYQDNVPGDITKGVHEVEIDCPDCRDIRDIIAKAQGRALTQEQIENPDVATAAGVSVYD